MRKRKERYSAEIYSVKIFLIAIVILIIVGVIIGVSYSESKSNNSNPGNSNPGNSNPGNSNPGNSNPGNSNPGNSNPGNSNPKNDKSCRFYNDINKKFTLGDVIPAQGGGNCFFHAVLYGLKCLNLYVGDHTNLRSDLCEFMLRDPFSKTYIVNNIQLNDSIEIREEDEDAQINKYVNHMKRNGVWASYIELYCIGHMFKDFCYFQCYHRETLTKWELDTGIDMGVDKPIINIYNIDQDLHYNSLPIYKPSSSVLE